MTKPTPSYQPSGHPLLSDPQLVMTLRGKWDSGGPLEVFLPVDTEPVTINLSRRLWTIMTELFLAAIHAEHWQDAEVPTADLIDRLEHYNNAADPDDQTVFKAVTDLRKKIAMAGILECTADAEMSANEWGLKLITNIPLRGYRLTIPPPFLKLYVGDLEYSVETVSSTDDDSAPSPK